MRIKLVKDIEISGEWTPIKFPVREFDGNGHTITFDGIRVVIEENSQGSFSAGLFDEMGGEKGTVVKDLTLAGDMTIDAQKKRRQLYPVCRFIGGRVQEWMYRELYQQGRYIIRRQ